MKYFNIEQLKTEIKRLKQENETSEDKDYAQYELDVAAGYDMALDEVLSILDSLKQEELPKWEKADIAFVYPRIHAGMLYMKGYKISISSLEKLQKE